METKELNRNARVTVLVVEDDRSLREFLTIALKRGGYEILQAGNGVEALDIAKGRPDDRIDVLLSDVAMPYMGGIQLAVRLRETQPDIQVLLISGLPLQEIRSRSGPSFTPNILAKPFSVSALLREVGQLVSAV